MAEKADAAKDDGKAQSTPKAEIKKLNCVALSNISTTSDYAAPGEKIALSPEDYETLSALGAVRLA